MVQIFFVVAELSHNPLKNECINLLNENEYTYPQILVYIHMFSSFRDSIGLDIFSVFYILQCNFSFNLLHLQRKCSTGSTFAFTKEVYKRGCRNWHNK